MKRVTSIVSSLVVVGALAAVGISYVNHSNNVTTVQAAVNSTNTNPLTSEPLTSLTDYLGQPVQIDPNKTTVLHFLVSSGCTSCGQSQVDLAPVLKEKPNVDFISIDIDPINDNKDSIKAFADATGVSGPYVLDQNETLLKQFHVTQLDTILVLKGGKVVYKEVAPSKEAVLKVIS